MSALRSAVAVRAGYAGADAMRHGKVDSTRQLMRRILESAGADVAELAFDLLSRDVNDALAASPSGPDLRAWHSLAADSVTALRPYDKELAERARTLAGQLRARTALIARNPSDRIAIRPTSRRVLEAILEAGGGGCPLADVRRRTSMSQPHLSNIVRVLSAHAFIVVRSDPEDGRGKLVSLTPAGRAAVARVERRRAADAQYANYFTAPRRALVEERPEQSFRPGFRVRSQLGAGA